ncbi:hypothetical protein AAC387_Pa04g1928 [Persea americana]
MSTSSNVIPMQPSHDLLPTSTVKSTEAEEGLELSTVPLEPSKSPKRSKTIKIMEERPAWLPEGWRMEVRTRTSIKRAGFRDRYYYNPKVHHCFRSRKEVEHFLETGTIREHKPKPKKVESANVIRPYTSFRSPNQIGFILKQQNPLRFNIKTCPAKVSWVLSNFGKGLWTPYINNEEVPKPTKDLWAAAMEDIINDANNF